MRASPFIVLNIEVWSFCKDIFPYLFPITVHDKLLRKIKFLRYLCHFRCLTEKLTEMTIRVKFDSDCHFCQLFGQTPKVAKIAEELDFPEKLIMNSDWEKIREYVLAKRPNLDI